MLQANGTLRESTLDVKVNNTQSTLRSVHYIGYITEKLMVFTYTVGLNACKLMDLAYE